MHLPRYFLILLSLFAATSVRANHWNNDDDIRGEGPVKEERREVGKIKAVELNTFGTLYIERADSTTLYVQAQENLLEYFKTEVRGGVLYIETKSRVDLRATEPVEYHLTVPDLEEVVLGSSGDAVMDPWKLERFWISLESSGDFECDSLACTNLDVNLESSGDLSLGYWEGESLRARLSSSGDCKIEEGKAKEVDVEIHSSGDFKAGGLKCAEATLSTNSSGSATLYVTDFLNARSSSSGDIVYYGNPEVDGRASSSGDIIARDR